MKSYVVAVETLNREKLVHKVARPSAFRPLCAFDSLVLRAHSGSSRGSRYHRGSAMPRHLGRISSHEGTQVGVKMGMTRIRQLVTVALGRAPTGASLLRACGRAEAPQDVGRFAAALTALGPAPLVCCVSHTCLSSECFGARRFKVGPRSQLRSYTASIVPMRPLSSFYGCLHPHLLPPLAYVHATERRSRLNNINHTSIHLMNGPNPGHVDNAQRPISCHQLGLENKRRL